MNTSKKTVPHRLGIVIAIVIMILSVVAFDNGWVEKFVSDPAPIATASAEPVAPSSVAIVNPADLRVDTIEYMVNSGRDWRSGAAKDSFTGEPNGHLFVRDVYTLKSVMTGAYDSGDAENFLRGDDGISRIPMFHFLLSKGIFRASIGDPDSVYRFQYDQSIVVTFVFVNKKGAKHPYSITGWRSEAGGVVFLKDEALQLLDLFMTSQSMEARIPTFGGHRDVSFDCPSLTLKAKTLLRDDLYGGAE